jgi:transposase
MNQYAGIDVSLECSSVCVVDANGKILREAKVASEPEALIGWFHSLGFGLERIGLEAGPLSQWLFAAMKSAGLAVELLETRHVRKAFEAMPVKSDRNDARGIAQLMRLGWFRPVHCKSMGARRPASWCNRSSATSRTACAGSCAASASKSARQRSGSLRDGSRNWWQATRIFR